MAFRFAAGAEPCREAEREPAARIPRAVERRLETPVRRASEPSTTPDPTPPLAVPGPSPSAARAEAERSATDRARVLAAALGSRLGTPVRLVVTDNRSSMFSARQHRGHIDVRANRVFLDASPAIIDAMAAAVHRDPDARERLRTFIRSRRSQIRPTVRHDRRKHVRTRGAHHDLARIFEELERSYFPDAMTGVRITWGPALSRRRRRRRSIQLGLYIPDDRLIRMHRALDQSWVPAFYVAGVVFHEMLHHCMPPIRKGRQVIFHTPQFRALEKVYPHHAEAERWEKANLDRLLSS